MMTPFPYLMLYTLARVRGNLGRKCELEIETLSCSASPPVQKRSEDIKWAKKRSIAVTAWLFYPLSRYKEPKPHVYHQPNPVFWHPEKAVRKNIPLFINVSALLCEPKGIPWPFLIFWWDSEMFSFHSYAQECRTSCEQAYLPAFQARQWT